MNERRQRFVVFLIVQLGLMVANGAYTLAYFFPPAGVVNHDPSVWLFAGAALQVLHGSLFVNGLGTFEGAAKLASAVGSLLPGRRAVEALPIAPARERAAAGTDDDEVPGYDADGQILGRPRD